MKSKRLIAAIEEQEKLATGSGALAEARQEALDHYLGKPYGDEEDGRSQVVMRDVADTIEWIKPSLLKIFCSGDEVVSFEPVGPEDEQQATQETEFVNHILMRKNEGFLILHDWFHDALLQKNGYVWAQNVKEGREDREQYSNLSDEELALLLQDPEVEVAEHSEEVDELGIKRHSVTLTKKVDYTCIKIKNVPPERVAVASDWPHLSFRDCQFIRILDYPTISDLRAQGYDVDDDISDTASSSDEDWAEQARDIDGDDDDTQESADPSTRRVKTRYVWIRYDSDDDGQAELHRMVVVGNTILEDEIDDLIPVASITPCRQPHEHDGLSIDDAVSDLQRIRTVLVRGFLDNMYLANNGRYAIDANRVNLDDMLTARPGGVVRTQGDPGGAIQPLVHPQVGGDVLQAIEYVDTVRENRTGVTKYNQGLDSNTLNKTASGVNSIMNASQQRIELIARIFAETGVKNLMLIIHAMCKKHSQKDEMVRLRNTWVPVSPRSWKHRSDMTVSVGLGTGNKDQILQQLTMLWQMQTAGMQFGIAEPTNLYETARRVVQNIGFKQAELFWSDPMQKPLQPPQPSPEQIKAQAEAQKVQFQAQSAKELKQLELQNDAQKFQAETQAQQAVDANRQEMEARQKQLELQQQAQLEAMRLEFEAREKEKDRQFELVKIQLQNQMSGELDMKREELKQNPAGRSMLEQLQEIAAIMSAPPKLVRDESGRAVGVQKGAKSYRIDRDQNGRAAGLSE